MTVLKEERPTGIKMTKKNRLAILKGARKILSNKKNWTTRALRKRKPTADDGYGYCLLGACERAAYDLELVEPGKDAFKNGYEQVGLGYPIGRELSLYAFSVEKHRMSPDGVNDLKGYDATMALLDDYIKEVQKGKARKA